MQYSRLQTLGWTGLVTGLSLSVLASAAQRTYVVTDATGTYLVTEVGGTSGVPTGPRSPGPIWAFSDPVAIPQNVALTPSSDSAWVAQDLNSQRIQRFAIDGAGTPLLDQPLTPTNGSTVAGSHGADLAAVLNATPSGFVLSTYSSTSNLPIWSYNFPPQYNSASYYGIKVSRDGGRVCALVTSIQQEDPNLPATYLADLHIFDSFGTLLRHWTYDNYADAIDLNDDGSLCLVTQGSSGRLIDTTSATEIFNAPGSGGGSRHKISGNGNVLVLGGFSLQVYKKISGVYTPVINFNAPNSWFGWGAAVSRDGKTVACMSHDYASGYANTSTRSWDVDSATLLGTFNTFAETAALQDAINGANVSDDGSIIAVSSWGAADNNHPEVMFFDRTIHSLGGLDTTGSPFSQDLSGSGQYALVGNKSVHANTFGNGGTTTSYEVVEQTCINGDVNCDCIVDLSDLVQLLAHYGETPNAPRSDGDLNGDGTIDLSDLVGLIAVFGSHC